MCVLTRRALLAGAVAGGLVETPSRANPEAKPTPEQALQRLVEGNARFVEGKTLHSHQSADWRKHLVGSQSPFVTVIGCSDSRVPVELIFDQGFGDVFVIRVAGNVVGPEIVGTLEYALVHLATPLVVVLGHQGCGAVTAALAELEKPGDDLPGLESLLSLIEPGLPRGILDLPAKRRLDLAVEANVRWSMKSLLDHPDRRATVERSRVLLKGAVYDLETGKARFLEN